MRHPDHPHGSDPPARTSPHRSRPPRADPVPTRPTGPAGARPRRHTTRTPSRPTRSSTHPIPATVWLCGQAADEAHAPRPTPVLAKVITAFTDPGAHVVVLAWPRPDSTAPESDRHPTDQAVSIEADRQLTAALQVAQDLGRTAELIHSTPGPAPGGLETATGADLVITSVGPEHADDRACEHIAAAAAAQLRTGGILAALTHSDWSGGKLDDPTGPIVAAAQNADLLYLQHIVLIHAPVRDGHFTIHPPGTSDHDGQSQHPATAHTAHHRIHTDLLAFAQPRDHHPLPLPLAARKSPTTSTG